MYFQQKKIYRPFGCVREFFIFNVLATRLISEYPIDNSRVAAHVYTYQNIMQQSLIDNNLSNSLFVILKNMLIIPANSSLM